MSVVRALTTRPTGLSDIGLLVGRVVVGGIFIAHGQQKFADGVGATGEGFDQMGVPAPEISAVLQSTLELVGGALLVLGALTTIVGLLLSASMIGAAIIVHADAFFVADGGWEFVGVLSAAALLFALVGPGRISVDGALSRRTQSPSTTG